MDLYLLNEINKLKGGGGSSQSGDSSSPGIYPNENPTEAEASQTIVSYSGINPRYYHQTYDWNSTHPYTGHSWHAYDSDWRTIEGKWRIPHGTGFNRYNSTGMHHGNGAYSRRTHYATKNTIGAYHMQTMSGRGGNDYQGHCVNIMFVRNTTNSDITKTVYGYYTNYWNNGYEGAAYHVYTPNHTAYSQVTRQNGSWSTPWNTSSGGGNHSSWNANTLFPANKTVALMFCNTLSYWTNFTYHTQVRNANYFSHLDSIFDGTGQLVCDLQMSQVYSQARIPEFQNENYNNNESFFRFYNKCGAIFGDRP